MAKEFLSQDEVDALLRGVADEPEAAAPAEASGGVREYNLATQDRIVRGRMPTLEAIHERFARALRSAIFEFMRRSPEISVGPVRVVKYGEFIRNLVVPTNLNVMQLKPLRGAALFILDPSLVFSVVDNMFGGDGRFPMRAEGRDFTPTEQRIIQRLLGVINEEYRKAWAPVHPLRFEYQRSEMHTQFASIATPAEMVVAATFSIELGSAGGAFHVCMPYSSIEPIRELLFSSAPADQAAPDHRWLRLLSRQVQGAEVELSARLAQVTLPIRRLAGLKAGDVIPLDIAPTIVASVDDVPVLECRYGTVNGQYAIRAERFLSARPNDNLTGEEDVH